MEGAFFANIEAAHSLTTTASDIFFSFTPAVMTLTACANTVANGTIKTSSARAVAARIIIAVIAGSGTWTATVDASFTERTIPFAGSITLAACFCAGISFAIA
jgi:hypothetical protein